MVYFVGKLLILCRSQNTDKPPCLNTFTTNHTDICESIEKSQEISIRCASTGMNCYLTTGKKELLMNTAGSTR